MEVCFQVADAYLTNDDTYYFQRSPQAFEAVFQYYANGVVHRPPELCPSAFLAELEFWRFVFFFIANNVNIVFIIFAEFPPSTLAPAVQISCPKTKVKKKQKSRCVFCC